MLFRSKTTSLFSNNVTGTGTIILDNTGQDETKINNAVFAGFEGELVLRGNLRFHGETGDSLASIQAITVESGTHLYMDNESSAGTPWNQNFTIAGRVRAREMTRRELCAWTTPPFPEISP